MKKISNKDELMHYVSHHKQCGKSIGFVPTMGALHQGHAALVKCAKRQNDITIVSIFVNQMQFGVNEDFDCYPRTIEIDIKKLVQLKVDVLFLPHSADICGNNYQQKNAIISVTSPNLVKRYCGKTRPVFFSGVLKVVAILFNIVMPHTAYFGKKDYQQLFLIKKMVQELHYPIAIESVATERDKNGLALSSRNAYLPADSIKEASLLYYSLQQVQVDSTARALSLPVVRRMIKKNLTKRRGFVLDYVAIVDSNTLLPLRQTKEHSVILLVVFFQNVRLLDNIEL